MPGRVPHNRWVDRLAYREAIHRVLNAGHPAQGREVEALEDELAARFRPRGAAACVSSGSAAVFLALSVMEPDVEAVSVPTYACSSIYAAAYLWASTIIGRDEARPRILDCDLQTSNTRSFIAVDTWGLPAQVDPAGIEDFTHAPGAMVEGRQCGSFGACSVISFGATKPLGAGGGGAVLGSKTLVAAVRALRDHHRPEAPGDSMNWQMSDLHAAIVRERLRRLDEENFWRTATMARYDGALPGTADILPQKVRRERTWYRFVVTFREPELAARARAHFCSRRVETIVPILPEEMPHRKEFAALQAEEHWPNAERLGRCALSLPIWPGMGTDDVEAVEMACESLDEVTP